MNTEKTALTVTAVLILAVPTGIILISAWAKQHGDVPVVNPEAGQHAKLADLTAVARESSCPAGSTFCFDPNNFTARTSEGTLRIENPQGNARHNLCVGEAGTCATTNGVEPGSAASVRFTFKSGSRSVEYWCDVQGHRALGMHGTITLNETPTLNATQTPVAESGGDAWNGTTTGTGLAEVTSDPREITVTRTANVVVRVEDAGAMPHAGALRVQVQGPAGSWEDDGAFTGSLAPGTYKVTVHAGAASVNAVRAWQATARWAS